MSSATAPTRTTRRFSCAVCGKLLHIHRVVSYEYTYNMILQTVSYNLISTIIHHTCMHDVMHWLHCRLQTMLRDCGGFKSRNEGPGTPFCDLWNSFVVLSDIVFQKRGAFVCFLLERVCRQATARSCSAAPTAQGPPKEHTIATLVNNISFRGEESALG